MGNFEEACALSCEKWIDSFPAEIPKHKFSKKHTEKIEEIFKKELKENEHKLSKKTVKFILIAAILLSLTITAFAVPSSRKFIVERFSNHSEYSVVDTDDTENVKFLKLNYIPTGFEKVKEYASNDIYIQNYRNSDKYFYVEKYIVNTSINFDSEKYNSNEIKINGMNVVYYTSDNEINGVIFNNGEYTFIINGNISKKELVNIAQNIG